LDASHVMLLSGQIQITRAVGASESANEYVGLQALALKLSSLPREPPGERTYLKYALNMRKIASLARLYNTQNQRLRAYEVSKRDAALTNLPHLLTLKSTRTQTRSEQEKRSLRALS